MASEMSGVTIRVSPQEIITKSEEVSSALARMEESYNLMKAMVVGTASYWEGEAGNSFRNMFQDKQDEMETMLNRLKNHTTNLLKMAGLYEENEDKLEEENVVLPANPLG